jgi:hypothetical protein
MREVPPAQPTSSSTYGKRPPLGSVPKLQVVAALCLFGVSVLPWIEWGLSYQQSRNIGIYYSLLQIVTNGSAERLGATWMYGVALGMAVALAGTVVEAALRPPVMYPRWMSAAGFSVAALAAALGAILILGHFEGSGTDFVTDGMTFGIAPGLLAGMMVAWLGAVLSIVHLTAPRNPEHVPEPFAPSPWGPLPGVVPPGFHPALGRDWVEYIERGETPPGYVPPSYGPPVYPRPGHVTPAYVPPGRAEITDWGPNFGRPGTDDGDSVTPGRLVVAEDGVTWSFTVKPGERLLVGRDPEAQIRVSDPRVAARHATIQRCPEGWAVQDVDASRPTRLIDAWGINRPVRGEIVVPAGQLIMGGVMVTLYPGQG